MVRWLRSPPTELALELVPAPCLILRRMMRCWPREVDDIACTEFISNFSDKGFSSSVGNTKFVISKAWLLDHWGLGEGVPVKSIPSPPTAWLEEWFILQGAGNFKVHPQKVGTPFEQLFSWVSHHMVGRVTTYYVPTDVVNMIYATLQGTNCDWVEYIVGRVYNTITTIRNAKPGKEPTSKMGFLLTALVNGLLPENFEEGGPSGPPPNVEEVPTTSEERDDEVLEERKNRNKGEKKKDGKVTPSKGKRSSRGHPSPHKKKLKKGVTSITEALQERLQQLALDIATHSSELKIVCHNLDEEVDDLHTALQSELDGGLAAELETVKSQLAKSDVDLLAVVGQNAALESTISELKEKVDMLQASFDSCNAQIAELQGEALQAQQRESRLGGEVQELRQGLQSGPRRISLLSPRLECTDRSPQGGEGDPPE